MFNRSLPALLALCVLCSPSAALATAGYFQLGYGLKSKGLGGAAAAYPQDTLVAATNPAGMVWVGNRLDAGLDWFEAERGSRITGNTLGLTGERDASGPKAFPIPELGYNRMLGGDASLGVAVYGNGGITRYADNPLAALGGSSPAGMQFVQAIVAPAFALKLGPDHSVGVALNLVFQRFVARGLQHFDDPLFSAAPGNVTNRGSDHARGLGWRFGWLGRLTPELTLGAAYQPRIRMGKFERYKGLFAGGGNFDVPENYVAGAAWRVAPSLTAVADIQWIRYSSVPSMGNSTECFLAVACLLGAGGGPGSGWRDTAVAKLGLAWQAAPGVTLRGGFTRLRSPIPPGQTLLNIYSPAVTEKHLSFGASWQVLPQAELTLSYMRAFENTVHGSGSTPPGNPPGGVGGGETDLRMKQRALGVALGWQM